MRRLDGTPIESTRPEVKPKREDLPTTETNALRAELDAHGVRYWTMDAGFERNTWWDGKHGYVWRYREVWFGGTEPHHQLYMTNSMQNEVTCAQALDVSLGG